jgi:hypothetical protein
MEISRVENNCHGTGEPQVVPESPQAARILINTLYGAGTTTCEGKPDRGGCPGALCRSQLACL